MKRWRSNLRRLRESVEDAGSIQNKRSELITGVNVLESDLKRIEDEKSSRRHYYQEKLAAWTSKVTDSVSRPVAIPEDKQDARRYQILAWAGMLIEIALAVWVFTSSLNIHWTFGALSALLAALFIYGMILAAFRRVDKPKQCLRLIRRWAFWPSLIVFVPSFCVLLLCRTVSGALAVTLLPFFELALWATTIGLIPLVGSLFAISYVLNWTNRDAKEYAELEREFVATRTLHDRFREELGNLEGGIHPGITRRELKPTNGTSILASENG